MSELIKSPIFGVLISLICYIIGQFISKKTKIAILNPLLIAITLVVLVLLTFNIPLDDYNNGGKIISFFLAPATVILAVPLYNKINSLKEFALPVLVGIFIGSVAGIFTVILLGSLINLDKDLILSLIPKSVTTPIGIELSAKINGIPSITVTSIIITGIIGAVFSPIILKVFKIKNPIAVGISIGTSAHALGTTKAVELGEIEGAMSGLSIGVAGIITVVVAPIIVNLFL
jgi:predicted murein hydrolase (TIGR00659 family)